MKSCRILLPMLVSLLLAGCGKDGPAPQPVDYLQPGALIQSGSAASRLASGVAQIRAWGVNVRVLLLIMALRMRRPI